MSFVTTQEGSRNRTREPMRALLACLALVFAASACSGGSDDAASGDPAAGDSAVDSGGADSGGSGGESAGGESDGVGSDGAATSTEPFTFDASALTATPLATGVLSFHGDGADGGVPALAPPEPLVDSCAAIDASTLSAIVSEADSSDGTYAFSSKADGATCLFQDDTHLIGVTVQTPDVLDEAYIESRNAFGGEITSRAAGDVTLYFDDAVGIVAFFAARVADSDFAVVVTNDGGTGVLAFEEEEVGWQRIAETALAGAPSAGPPSEEATAAGALAPTNICSAFETADLNAAFDVEFVERGREATNCVWATSDEVIWIRMTAIRPGVTADDYADSVDVGDGVISSERGFQTRGLQGDNTFEVSVEITTDRYGLAPIADGLPGQVNATPIAEQMVRNLLDRLAA